jgi:short-subunit dehydrogenase
MRLKKLSAQVIVITGATSGIGLTTARMAAARGAKLVLAARSEDALSQLEQELRARGVEAFGVPTDVGDQDAVESLAHVAMARFGRIDTWVNNAGISIYGRTEQVAMEDQHRLFQTNFWGTVHGSLAAVKHMKQRGGALINVGSELSDVTVPLQGMYAASKHAVKGFTDSLRMELEKDGAPVSVTLIKPAAIDTMFTVHAKNYLDKEPKLPAPLYAPELVAEAILSAAETPQRDIFVGGASKFNSAGGLNLPRLFDKYSEAFMFSPAAEQASQRGEPQRCPAFTGRVAGTPARPEPARHPSQQHLHAADDGRASDAARAAGRRRADGGLDAEPEPRAPAVRRPRTALSAFDIVLLVAGSERDGFDVVNVDIGAVRRCGIAACGRAFAGAAGIGIAVQVGVPDVRACGAAGRALVGVFIGALVQSRIDLLRQAGAALHIAT